MNKKTGLSIAILLAAFIMLSVSCRESKKEKTQEIESASKLEVNIGGMTCTGCEQTIQRKVGNLEGIKSVKATFTDGKALIEYFPSLADTAEIREAITGSGYTVQSISPSSK